MFPLHGALPGEIQIVTATTILINIAISMQETTFTTPTLTLEKVHWNMKRYAILALLRS